MNAIDQLLKAEQGFMGEFEGMIYSLAATDADAILERFGGRNPEDSDNALKKEVSPNRELRDCRAFIDKALAIDTLS